jgi:coenzyme F420-reducing hydrogenase beta subunit
MIAGIGIIIPEKNNQNCITGITSSGLCIGCGICHSVCPSKAIEIVFDVFRRYIPAVSSSKCKNCGQCINVCPNTPDTLAGYAISAMSEGKYYGLNNSVGTFVGYDLNLDSRLRSSSGGIVTAFLRRLIQEGLVDGVIAVDSKSASYGGKYHETSIFRNIDELENSRGSKYYPVTYSEVLKTVLSKDERYAVVGVPCIIRGVKKLPDSIKNKIKFTVSLFCGHNVTGQFVEQLARHEGIKGKESFTVNLRDKFGIASADDFNNVFILENGEIKRRKKVEIFNRFYLNYYYAHEACLYCPDAFGVDADLSAKDAWGKKYGKDPHGCSYVVVRDAKVMEIIQCLRKEKKIFLEPVDTSEIIASQQKILKFKHINIKYRLFFKKDLRRALQKTKYQYRLRDVVKFKITSDYLVKLMTIKLSRYHAAFMPGISILWSFKLIKLLKKLLR